MKDRVALVTGGASGIGRATALAFAREGAQVIVVDRDAAGGEHVISEIRNAGGRGLFIRGDVSVASDVERAIGNATKAYGHLDFAVNNAGVEGENATVREYDEQEFDRVIATNLKSVWLCMKYEIAAFPDRGGAIVNMASVAGLVGYTEEPAYIASKHGVIGLTRAAALELAPRKIRVNAICPGAIDTPMLHRSTSGDDLKDYIENTPQRRVGKPEEIAAAVLWLCSEGAAFVTGVALPVDGGWTVQ
ncbi:MAG TPA: glucose 1-dehydrogenase [Kofleriaceae bacterium]|nr:glucose 1-dehydrogenase [Kofleriaceae bacterium]